MSRAYYSTGSLLDSTQVVSASPTTMMVKGESMTPSL